MGCAGFSRGRKIFATLASAKEGYGNLKLTPEQQAAFVEEMPEVFVPIRGGWGRMGMSPHPFDSGYRRRADGSAASSLAATRRPQSKIRHEEARE